MGFIEEWTFDVKEGQFGAYQEWLAANEAELAKHMPDGVEYIGTFACVFGDDSKGFARVQFRLDEYGSMDTSVAAMRGGGRYAELVQESQAFLDLSNGARNGHELWKEVTDTVFAGD